MDGRNSYDVAAARQPEFHAAAAEGVAAAKAEYDNKRGQKTG